VDNVSACSFAYVTGVSASNGLVTLRLSITRKGETITLHHQIHIDNVP
jgi:MSHA biogenesis protein MshO